MTVWTPPSPRLDDVVNDTPFEVFSCDKMGVGRRFYDTVVLKGTFALTPDQIRIADEQRAILLGDELWNPEDSEHSSLKHAGEVLLTKPTTDVILSGHARPQGGRPLADWWASVEVRGRDDLDVHHRCCVVGPNEWRRKPGYEWVLTDPEPTDAVPIRYELAFGGSYRVLPPGGAESVDPSAPREPQWVVYDPNPSGCGLFDDRCIDDDLETFRAPQWLPDPSYLGVTKGSSPLAGFGPVARPWPWRLQYAGTHDEAWLARTRQEIAEGLPADYAADFDTRFFQCAHPGLVMPRYLDGNEHFRLTGLVAGDEPYLFQLPGLGVRAALVDGVSTQSMEMLNLDTVLIDVDAALVSLCWRLSLDQERDIRSASFALVRVR